MSAEDVSVSRPSPDRAGDHLEQVAPDPSRVGKSDGPIAATALSLLQDLFGPVPPVAIELWDGTRIGAASAEATIRVNSVDALVRTVQHPGQLGLARAYVAGDITVDGDIFTVLALPDMVELTPPKLSHLLRLAWACRTQGLRRLPVPPEEAHLRGLRRHSPTRDRQAVSHHYDVSNDFYRLVLGPTMTYSCAVWASPESGLDDAQVEKHDLVCRKLGLQPGDRLLDVGCGWGTLARHAADRFGATAVGITLSEEQRRWASTRTEGSPGVELRLQDYRELHDPPFDAISSVGMSEHVGRSNLPMYFGHLYRSLKPGGRILNHAITALPTAVGGQEGRWPRLLRLPGRGRARLGSFVDRYVFPDGELIEVGAVVSAMQEAGFEVRHVESLREHYGLTLRAWVANLKDNWDEAVDLVGIRRARVWRLYMAASARAFEAGKIGVHQVLAVRPQRGRSGFALRPRFER